MNQIKQNSKLSACLGLVRNSLAEGNDLIKNTISESNFDKSRSFDKIVSMILIGCMAKITDKQMESVIK
jgi:hypothetical protein